MPQILVVDDEPKIASVVCDYLKRDGFQVLEARDGLAALAAARQHAPDLIVLDLMLPGMSGLEVCRTLRRESNVPIIMLTARAEETDKLVGLGLGADDYVVKPFSPRELVARVHAVLRRARGELTRVIHQGELCLDLDQHTVTLAGAPVDLTPTEFDLLAVLAGNAGKAFSRLDLLERVQGHAYEGYSRAIDVHIMNLRQKIEPATGEPRYIQTVYGVGYKFAPQG
ncbi:MAG: response regulator transcription factor [Chloroflexi bacterium]|nr:response regulator transcription factor [Chloroflexota bacterium]MBU1748065.1 response regulator transcription factor [Chloroflexota bacterium]